MLVCAYAYVGYSCVLMCICMGLSKVTNSSGKLEIPYPPPTILLQGFF